MLIYIIIYLLSSTPSTNCCQTAESNQRTCRQRIREIPLLPQCETHTSIRVTIYEQAYTLKINTACDCTSIMYLLQYFILYLSKLVLWQVGGHSTEFDEIVLYIYILYIHITHSNTYLDLFSDNVLYRFCTLYTRPFRRRVLVLV